MVEEAEVAQGGIAPAEKAVRRCRASRDSNGGQVRSFAAQAADELELETVYEFDIPESWRWYAEWCRSFPDVATAAARAACRAKEEFGAADCEGVLRAESVFGDPVGGLPNTCPAANPSWQQSPAGRLVVKGGDTCGQAVGAATNHAATEAAEHRPFEAYEAVDNAAAPIPGELAMLGLPFSRLEPVRDVHGVPGADSPPGQVTEYFNLAIADDDDDYDDAEDVSAVPLHSGYIPTPEERLSSASTNSDGHDHTSLATSNSPGFGSPVSVREFPRDDDSLCADHTPASSRLGSDHAVELCVRSDDAASIAEDSYAGAEVLPPPSREGYLNLKVAFSPSQLDCGDACCGAAASNAHMPDVTDGAADGQPVDDTGEDVATVGGTEEDNAPDLHANLDLQNIMPAAFGASGSSSCEDSSSVAVSDLGAAGTQISAAYVQGGAPIGQPFALSEAAAGAVTPLAPGPRLSRNQRRRAAARKRITDEAGVLRCCADDWVQTARAALAAGSFDDVSGCLEEGTALGEQQALDDHGMRVLFDCVQFLVKAGCCADSP